MAVLALLAAVLLPVRPAKAGDPAQQWRTVTTPHFFIHYYKNTRHDEREAAHLVGIAAERAHAKLVRTLQHVPSERTHIVLTDDTDGANGSAQIVPYNIIRLYATGPSSLSPLNDYDDWLYGLVLHEYTHILHVDTIHGLARVVNAVLGKTWAPNQIQPRWFIEGLAVFFESERSSGGRLRSSIYDMYLRMAVLEGKLLDMDQITSNTRYYPRGTVPYLYGARFLKYLGDRFGEDKLVEISHDYGGSVIPYGINRVAARVLGHTYVELYADFRRYLRERYGLQREAAEQRGLTPFRRITDHGEAVASPRYSSDGKELVFFDSDGHSQTAIKVLDVASGTTKEQFDSFGGSGVDFTPDREQLVYGESSTWRSFYGYQDLYVRHRRTGRVRQLTFGLRAHDPVVSPDGRQVAFVTNELGVMSLAMIPFEGGAPTVLYRGQHGDQLFTPSWSPDGRTLVYSRWQAGGERDLYLMEVASRKVRRLTADRALDTDPVFSADGQRIYFSSDRTGIFNLYCLTLTSGELRQVSNVVGGAFSPAVSPDERTAYYVGFSARGFDLHAMKLRREAYLPVLPYVNDRPRPEVPTIERIAEQRSFADRPYSVLRTLYPRAWMFNMGYDAWGTTLGVSLDGADVVGRHSYAARVAVGTSGGHTSYQLVYGYSRLWPSIQLDTSRGEGPRGGLSINGIKRNYIEQNYGFGASVGLPVLRVPDHAADISMGYRLNWMRDGDPPHVLVGPDTLPPEFPAVGLQASVSLGLSYRSVRRYAWSISGEKGRMIGIGMRFDHPDLGSDFQSTELSYNWTEFIDLPWANEHVLALRLGGGILSGNLSRRGIFYVGGFPEQDVVEAFFRPESRINGPYLRGYPPGIVSGDQYHLLNVEYRLPLFDIEHGALTLPLYFNNVHMAAFTDVGNAFFGNPELSKFKVGVGAELKLEMVIGYFLPATLRVGYARGLREGGGNQYHILFGQGF